MKHDNAHGVAPSPAPSTLKGYEELLLDVIQRAQLPADDAWKALDALAGLVMHATAGVTAAPAITHEQAMAALEKACDGIKDVAVRFAIYDAFTDALGVAPSQGEQA